MRNSIFILFRLMAVFGCTKHNDAELLYTEVLEPDGFRYEVYQLPDLNIMPGGGYGSSGFLKVYNSNGDVILEKALESTYIDAIYHKGELVIGNDTWNLDELNKKHDSSRLVSSEAATH